MFSPEVAGVRAQSLLHGGYVEVLSLQLRNQSFERINHTACETNREPD